MKVFSLATGADTAGIGYGFARAFKRSGIKFRSMAATPNYIRYPVDVRYSVRRLRRFYDDADVVILHNTTHGHDWYDVTGKPTVLMHHGRTPLDRFREVVTEAEAFGAVQIGSTIDLSVFGPVTWMPPPVDVKAMQALRRRVSRSGLRVVHAPTNRDIKGTSAFVGAMERLSRRYDVQSVLVEHLPWSKCLELKAGCDILYDQSVLGYGSNAIEAFAMGIPVLVGVEDPRVRERMVETWGELPFLETTEATLERDIERLIIDPGLRAEYGQRGLAHAMRWHADEAVVERLLPILRAAPATVPGKGLKRPDRVLTRASLAHNLTASE